MKLTVLVSGRGSNLAALLDAIDAGRCQARVGAVISDKKKAPALDVARERGVDTHVVRPRDHEDRPAWDRELARVLVSTAPDLVVLAGFMRLVGAPVLDAFRHRMINVHPSLLPAFPGKDSPAAAVAAGVRVSGCTVHLVDDGVDSGHIVAQAAVPVLADDDAAALHTRIQQVEHRLLPAVVNAIATGTLELGPPPRFSGEPGEPGGLNEALIQPPIVVDPEPGS